MRFVCFGDDMPSKNDKDIHYITSVQTECCFSDALRKLNVNIHDVEHLRNCPENLKGRNFDDVIKLFPRVDGNYSMVDEIFSQYVPKEKWASVAITGKDGKPFYIKDNWLKFQIIMRCEKAVVRIGGNNRLLNKLIKGGLKNGT